MSITPDKLLSIFAIQATNPPVAAAELERTTLPGLGAATVTPRVMTPQGVHDQSPSGRGGAFGTEPLPFRSIWFRPPNRGGEAGQRRPTSVGAHPKARLPDVPRSPSVLDQVVPDAAVALG